MTRTGTAVISGAAGQLGRAVGRRCARTFAHLVLVDRNRDGLAAAAAELAASGAGVVSVEADFADTSTVSGIFDGLSRELWATAPALVVTHGVAGRAGNQTARLGSLNRTDWDATLAVNLTSVVFLIEAFLPLTEAAKGGRIVLVSSAAGLAASPTAALSYAVSKAGIAALPRALAEPLGARGVLINAVAPGKFVNPDWPDTAESIARYAATVPLGRLADADEVAALIAFLASPDNTYVTGQTILQDGGRLSGVVGSRPA